MKEEDILEMITNKTFIELPICPFCGELTDLRGERVPCCGRRTEEVAPKVRKWVRLIPVDIVSGS